MGVLPPGQAMQIPVHFEPGNNIHPEGHSPEPVIRQALLNSLNHLPNRQVRLRINNHILLNKSPVYSRPLGSNESPNSRGADRSA